MRSRFAPCGLPLALAAALLAGTAAVGQPQKYPLREGFATGDQVVKESAKDFSAELRPVANGKEMPPQSFVMRSLEQYTQQVLAADKTGPSSVRRVYTTARSYQTDSEGTKKQVVSPLQGKAVTVRRVDGRVVIVGAKVELSEGDRAALAGALGAGALPFFPDHPVAPGDQWTVDQKRSPRFLQGFPSVRNAQIQCRFEEVVPFAGQRCARLHCTMELDMASDASPGGLTMHLAGDIHHALALGRTLSVDLSGPLTMSGGKKNDVNTLTVSGEGKARLRETYRWLKVAGKPVRK